MTIIATAGCSTPAVRQWQHQLWLTSDETANDTQDIGALETEDLTFGLACTEFRQVDNVGNRIFRIAVSCRNETNDTILLESNPIQVINAARSIVQPLSLDHVMYKLYGGMLRERAQLAQLNEPPVNYGDSLAENFLAAIVNAYRSAEHGAIITELHIKEALPYELHYKSFVPTSLPAGVSTHWIEYFPASTDTILVMLQGEGIEDAVTFESPPPAPLPEAESKEPDANAVVAILLFGIGVAVYIANDS